LGFLFVNITGVPLFPKGVAKAASLSAISFFYGPVPSLKCTTYIYVTGEPRLSKRKKKDAATVANALRQSIPLPLFAQRTWSAFGPVGYLMHLNKKKSSRKRLFTRVL